MHIIKKVNLIKHFKIIAILLALLLCQQISPIKAETKTTNSNLNKTLDLHAMSVKIQEMKINDLYASLDTYLGTLTGYVADCPLCSGFLGCNGQNVLDRTIFYEDNDYGNVRIVASSKSLPCGSIIRFNSPSISDSAITAIVLDRGVIGTAIDLLVESEEVALSSVGKRQISYDILRFGY